MGFSFVFPVGVWNHFKSLFFDSLWNHDGHWNVILLSFESGDWNFNNNVNLFLNWNVELFSSVFGDWDGDFVWKSFSLANINDDVFLDLHWYSNFSLTSLSDWDQINLLVNFSNWDVFSLLMHGGNWHIKGSGFVDSYWWRD